jgi:hypothetical protein
MCFEFLYNFCRNILILRKTERDKVKMDTGLHVNYPLFLSDYIETRQNCEKYTHNHIPRKSVQWEPSCCVRTDRQTYRRADMTKLVAAFRNFANAPKNSRNILAQNADLQYTEGRHVFCNRVLWSAYARIVRMWLLVHRLYSNNN